MILVDYNQVVISALTTAEFGGGQTNFDEGYVKHLVINMLRSYKVKYGCQFGEIVICCDARDYWRKAFYKYYKANRKKDRESSDFDWENIFKCMDTVRTDLMEYFPYPVVRVNGAEGDDVIYTLAEWSQSNDLTTEGIFTDEPKPLLILSTDGDLVQCQRFSNVKQYSPKHKKFITPAPGTTVEQYINEHIAEGDRGDGVPNVLSADNCIVDKIRQTSLKQARRQEFISMGVEACKTEEEQSNYERNQTLIDFRYIPDEVKERITEEFETQLNIVKARGRKRVMGYLIKNRMSLLIENLSDF